MIHLLKISALVHQLINLNFDEKYENICVLRIVEVIKDDS